MQTTARTGEVVKDYGDAAGGHSRAVNESLWEHSHYFTVKDLITRRCSLKQAKVLDLACGEGILSRWCAAQGATSVLGLDISPEMVDTARSNDSEEMGHGRRVVYKTADARSFDPKDTGLFDVVLGFHVLCHARDAQELRDMVRNVGACLVEGGHFFG